MTRIILILPFLLLLFGACKKTAIEGPINKESNSSSLNCATCPSIFHPYQDISETISTTCDDFTDLANWPTSSVAGEAILGYTQGGIYPISISDGSFVEINGSPDISGFYGVGDLTFNMEPTEQTARFSIYGIYAQFGEMGFRVDDFDYTPMDIEFPISFGETVVDIDSITTEGTWTDVYLTFTGTFESILIQNFESGITELCITRELTVEPPVFDTTASIYFTDFFQAGGISTGYFPTSKTVSGYFGNQGVAMKIHFDDFLAYPPSRISFVHAHNPDMDNLLNVQLPGTPLLISAPENLNAMLKPFNYQAEVYSITNGTIWQNSTTIFEENAIVDSIIITGINMNSILIGANLMNSELRSVCTYYEE